MTNRYILYSDQGSGGVAVEAALTLMGQPYDLVEAPTSEPQDTAGGDRVLAANPMRQVPALVFPGGEVMTESAAILIRLGELHPQAGLVPGAEDPRRSQFLRWMSFVRPASSPTLPPSRRWWRAPWTGSPSAGGSWNARSRPPATSWATS